MTDAPVDVTPGTPSHISSDMYNADGYEDFSSVAPSQATPIPSGGNSIQSAPQSTSSSSSSSGPRSAPTKNVLGVVRVALSEPETRGSFGSKYSAYRMDLEYMEGVQPIGEDIFRRFSDFEWLRNVLVKMFPGVFVPPMPPKKAIGRFDKKFIARRRAGLQRFSNDVLRRSQLASTEACKIMYTYPSRDQFRREQSAIDKALKKIDAEQQGQNLRSCFPDVCAKSIPKHPVARIHGLREFIEASLLRLHTLVGDATKLHNLNLDSVLALHALEVHFGSLKQLEDAFPTLPKPGRVDMSEPTGHWCNFRKESARSVFTNLLGVLRAEHNDTVVFYELIKAFESALKTYTKSFSKAFKWDRDLTSPFIESMPRISDPPVSVDTLTQKKRVQRTDDLKRERDQRALLGFMINMMIYEELPKLRREHMARYSRACADLAQDQCVLYMEMSKDFGTIYQSVEKVARASALGDQDLKWDAGSQQQLLEEDMGGLKLIVSPKQNGEQKGESKGEPQQQHQQQQQQQSPAPSDTTSTAPVQGAVATPVAPPQEQSQPEPEGVTKWGEVSPDGGEVPVTTDDPPSDRDHWLTNEEENSPAAQPRFDDQQPQSYGGEDSSSDSF